MNWKFWFFGKAICPNTTQHKPVVTSPKPIEPTKHISNMDAEEIRSVIREELSQSKLDYDKLTTAIVTALNNANKQETDQHKNIITRLSEIARTFALISPIINTLLAGFGIWILSQCLQFIQTHWRNNYTLVIFDPSTCQSTYIIPTEQDFTEYSDVDWSQSVADIDKQLYTKYGLSQNEIDFIESHVKEMA